MPVPPIGLPMNATPDRSPAADIVPTGVRIVSIRCDRIRMHPRNIRSGALTGLDRLAASIRRHGVQVPLVVHQKYARTSTTQDLELLDGHRRLAAAEIAGLTRVPCEVRRRHSDMEAILAMIAFDQRERVDVKGMQKAVRALRTEFGLSEIAIAEQTGSSVEQVRAWLCGAGNVPPAPVEVGPTPSPARPLPPLQRVPHRRPANPAPRFPAARIHSLVTECRAGRLAAEDVVGRLAGMLGGWEPEK